MKRMLMRPTAALFPVVLLVAALLGNEIVVENLFVYTCVIQLFSLCGVDSFRNAAAREPGVRRVDRRFSGAWPVLAFGIAAAAVICMVWGKNAADLPVLIAAGMVIIEQLFEERMYAIGKNMDGVMLSAISNVLLAVGLILDGGGLSAPAEGFYAACGAGLGTVISVAASYIIEPMHAFSLMPRNIAFFPKAALQCLLYPAMAALVLGFNPSAYGGLILWRLSRTVCRRSHDESRPLNLLLMASTSVLLVAGLVLPVGGIAIAAAVAAVCAVAVYCAPGWRIYCGAVLVGISACQMIFSNSMPREWNLLPAEWTAPLVCACCAIAVVLNLHRAFLRKV